MKKVLDKILLSDNVLKEYYKAIENTQFKDWLCSVLPEIQKCKYLKQDNPWHIYNCLDHILHSVEEMNKQTKDLKPSTRRIMAYTMFLHDVGKPECYIRRYSKAYEREVDSFFDHNLAGEKIAHRVLPQFGFNKKESELIEFLVKQHDMFINITLTDEGNRYKKVLTNELLDNLINEFSTVGTAGNGDNVLKLLVMVARADNLAQNPKMTKDALKLLDIVNEKINEDLGNSSCTKIL